MFNADVCKAEITKNFLYTLDLSNFQMDKENVTEVCFYCQFLTRHVLCLLNAEILDDVIRKWNC